MDDFSPNLTQCPSNNTLLSMKVQFDICKCTDGLIFILRMPGLIILPQDPFGSKITQFCTL